MIQNCTPLPPYGYRYPGYWNDLEDLGKDKRESNPPPSVPSIYPTLHPSAPMAPIIRTTMTNLDVAGAETGKQTRVEIKLYSPDQLQALGKIIGPLNRKTAVHWLATTGSIPGYCPTDFPGILRKCTSPEDFSALPTDVKLGTNAQARRRFETILKLFYLGENLLAKYHCEKQAPAERPEIYEARKRILFVASGLAPDPNNQGIIINYDVNEFKKPFIQGLHPELKIAVGGVFNPSPADKTEAGRCLYYCSSSVFCTAEAR